MAKLSVTLVFVLAANLCSAAALADGQQIYKWVDSQGVVHYSDKAPAKTVQPVTHMTLAALPAVDAQTEAQNQAWIAGINQWYQSIVAQETQQQYNQILAWQESQDQAAQSNTTSNQEITDVTPIYGAYRPFHFRHRNFEHHRSRQPINSVVFRPNVWSTQPNSFSNQLYNTNPNAPH